MKRLWSTSKFVTGQRIRSKKLDRRRRNIRRPSPAPFRIRDTVTKSREQELFAPNVLSLFDEPDATIRFVNSLREKISRQGTEVFLNFNDVQNFTSDALLLLRAIMDPSVRAPDTRVRGNLPSNPNVAAEFKASGFFAGFTKPPRDLPAAQGLMEKKSAKTVYSKQAADLVDFAMNHVRTTTHCANGCYRNLVEVMTNTHNHATKQRRGTVTAKHGHEKWYASVYCRDNVAYFSFIDLGVGILKSAPVKHFVQKAMISISSYGRTSLLKDVFEGRIGSATGKPGRGLGLPKMKQEVDAGRLAGLQVLTSDVVGPVASLAFKSVREPLRGTAFRWHVRQEGGGR